MKRVMLKTTESEHVVTETKMRMGFYRLMLKLKLVKPDNWEVRIED